MCKGNDGQRVSICVNPLISGGASTPLCQSLLVAQFSFEHIGLFFLYKSGDFFPQMDDSFFKPIQCSFPNLFLVSFSIHSFAIFFLRIAYHFFNSYFNVFSKKVQNIVSRENKLFFVSSEIVFFLFCKLSNIFEKSAFVRESAFGSYNQPAEDNIAEIREMHCRGVDNFKACISKFQRKVNGAGGVFAGSEECRDEMSLVDSMVRVFRSLKTVPTQDVKMPELLKDMNAIFTPNLNWRYDDMHWKLKPNLDILDEILLELSSKDYFK